MSCAGMLRGAGGWAIVGGRQCGDGGGVRGGPEYSVPGRGAGFAGSGVAPAELGSGRCQYASSGTPVGVVTFTDGTAAGGRLPQRRGPTLVGVDILDEPERDNDAEREVDFESEEAPVLPDQTRDDTERGWGEQSYENDYRLLEDRPPHW